jgi:hypothetical protein
MKKKKNVSSISQKEKRWSQYAFVKKQDILEKTYDLLCFHYRYTGSPFASADSGGGV